MDYSEVKVFMKMKGDVNCDNMYEMLNKYINVSLLNDSKLSKIHKENVFKFYTYCLPYPIEKDKIYHKERIYCFNIRSVNNEIIVRIGRCLKKEDSLFTVEGISYDNYHIHNISKLITLTPVVVTMDNGKYWKTEDGFEQLIKRLGGNGERKFIKYYGDCNIEKGHSFIENIEQKNKRLILIPYKGSCLFGNKFEIEVKQDEQSQLIASFVSGVGLGEKNTIGMGYCKVIYGEKGE